LEAGAEDVDSADDGSIEVTTAWEDFSAVKAALEGAGLELDSGEVTMVAATTVPVDVSGAETVIGLIDALEELDDVQNVYSNVDIPDEVLEALS
jgi:transcriptional/translational regulatory protein YebC/TACO1